MEHDLTNTHTTIKALLPATASDIAQDMGYQSNSTVYDHISEMRSRGLNITQNSENEYVQISSDGGTQVVNNSQPIRQTSASKQTITKKANQFLTELEIEVKQYQNEVGPAIEEGPQTYNPGNQDLVIHCTDDHFGDVERNEMGEETFNSEIAAERIRNIFTKALEAVDLRERIGVKFDTAHVLLGGDHVTNESIYDKQPWDVKETIKEQIKLATNVYFDQVERMSDQFPSVQVVCMHGNHGEFRVDGSSGDANADIFLFDRLEAMVSTRADMNNVTFIKSDTADHTNFRMRGGRYKAHLRHGQFISNHVGTSSPKSDWRSYALEYDFDIAYRGHYHKYKVEPINGRPIIMGGSVKPPDEYAGKMGEFSWPMSHIHGVSDNAVLQWTDYIYH